MTNTIEALRAKHAAEIERLTVELAIAANAPVSPKRAFYFKPISWLIYDAVTLSDAIAIMNAAPIVPFDRTKAERGRFTRLWPWSITTADEKDNWQHISGPFACSIHTNQGKGFGPSAELRFFVQCGDSGICAAHINLVGQYSRDAYPQWGAQPIYAAPYGNRIIDWRANVRLSAPSQEHIKWGAGDISSASYDYLFSADTQSGGTDHASAMLAQLLS